MSWRASQWAVAQKAGSAAAKSILLVLAEDFRNGACTLSHADVAERAEVDRRTVVRQMKNLEARGLISRARRTDEYGHRTSDRIVLSFVDPTDSPTHGPSDIVSPRPPAQSDTTPPAKVTNDASLGGTVAQQVPVLPIEPVALRESSPVPMKPARKKPARALPDICPTVRDTEWAQIRLQGVGLVLNLSAEAERFRDYHLAKGTVSADWAASWRTWIGMAVKWAQERPAGFAPRARQQSELEHAMETLRGE